MLRPIIWVLKVAFFAVIVLALGNWVHWKGKTVSDQVKTQLSQAEHLTGTMTESAKTWVQEKKQAAQDALDDAKESVQNTAEQAEKIQSSERQKLRALIKELNGTQKKD